MGKSAVLPLTFWYGFIWCS